MSSPPVPRELAARVRVVVLDADGVLTDGGIYLAEQDGGTFESRKFHVRDGVGVIMLARAGIVVSIVSAKVSAVVRRRAADLGIDEVHQVSPFEKLAAVEGVLSRARASWEEAAFIGDDLADIPALRAVGLAGTVADAPREVLDSADWVSTRCGGDGAVREFAEALLAARGEWTSMVEGFVEECIDRWNADRGE